MIAKGKAPLAGVFPFFRARQMAYRIPYEYIHWIYLSSDKKCNLNKTLLPW